MLAIYRRCDVCNVRLVFFSIDSCFLQIRCPNCGKIYVVSSAFSTNTTVTVYAGDDYSLVSGAITSPYYSYVENPQGFPSYFNFTPNFSGVGSMTVSSLSVSSATFSLIGRQAFVLLRVSFTTGGSAGYSVKFTPPHYLSSSGGGGGGLVRTNGTEIVSGFYYGESDHLNIRKYDNSIWDLTTGRLVYMSFNYLI